MLSAASSTDDDVAIDGPIPWLEPYVHVPLDLSKRCIRVVRIEPDAHDAPIRCSLRPVAIDTDNYVCLSYHWGSHSSNAIAINDGHFHVSSNLFAFLHQARDLHIGDWLWIDAICIDQRNSRERNHQAQHMSVIYRSAAKVLMWPANLPAHKHGRPPPYRSSALGYPSRLSTKIGDIVQESNPYNDYTVSSKPSCYDWRSLRKLCRSPYFDRLWIVQEVVLAKDAVILWGANTIRLVDFTRFVEVARGGERLLSEWTWPIGKYPRFLSATKRGDTSLWSRVLRIRKHADDKTRTFRELAQTLGPLQCSDGRDRIYGLAGIASDAGSFKIDYDISLSNLVSRMVLLSQAQKEFKHVYESQKFWSTYLGIQKHELVPVPLVTPWPSLFTAWATCSELSEILYPSLEVVRNVRASAFKDGLARFSTQGKDLIVIEPVPGIERTFAAVWKVSQNPQSPWLRGRTHSLPRLRHSIESGTFCRQCCTRSIDSIENLAWQRLKLVQEEKSRRLYINQTEPNASEDVLKNAVQIRSMEWMNIRQPRAEWKALVDTGSKMNEAWLLMVLDYQAQKLSLKALVWPKCRGNDCPMGNAMVPEPQSRQPTAMTPPSDVASLRPSPLQKAAISSDVVQPVAKSKDYDGWVVGPWYGLDIPRRCKYEPSWCWCQLVRDELCRLNIRPSFRWTLEIMHHTSRAVAPSEVLSKLDWIMATDSIFAGPSVVPPPTVYADRLREWRLTLLLYIIDNIHHLEQRSATPSDITRSTPSSKDQQRLSLLASQQARKRSEHTSSKRSYLLQSKIRITAGEKGRSTPIGRRGR